MEQIQALADELKGALTGATSVVISTHLNPDGDALGSSLAFAFVLDQLGVPCEVICHNQAPYNLQFLPALSRVKLDPAGTHDFGVALDLDSLHRLGRHENYFASLPALAVIDHHQPHEKPGTIRIVDPKAPATALILFRLFKAWQIAWTADIATCLLAGIVTDTGSFRYPNTTDEALEASAELLAAGGNISLIAEEVYAKRPLASVRLLGRTLDKMKLSEGDRIAWAALGPEDFADTGASESHTEGLVNELLSINTVQMAAILRQPFPDKLIRASIRSRGSYDVAQAVRPFGGGGHRNAAGCTFEGTLPDAESQLVGALRACLES